MILTITKRNVKQFYLYSLHMHIVLDFNGFLLPYLLYIHANFPLWMDNKVVFTSILFT